MRPSGRWASRRRTKKNTAEKSTVSMLFNNPIRSSDQTNRRNDVVGKSGDTRDVVGKSDGTHDVVDILADRQADKPDVDKESRKRVLVDSKLVLVDSKQVQVRIQVAVCNKLDAVGKLDGILFVADRLDDIRDGTQFVADRKWAEVLERHNHIRKLVPGHSGHSLRTLRKWKAQRQRSLRRIAQQLNFSSYLLLGQRGVKQVNPVNWEGIESLKAGQ